MITAVLMTIGFVTYTGATWYYGNTNEDQTTD